MHMHSLNWLAILVAAIACMILGFVWYSPLLFAKPWTREMGYGLNDKAEMDEMRKHAGPAYAGSFVAALIAAFTLALILHGMSAESLDFGLMASFHIWLGFVATVQFTGALFAKQSMKLFAINTGYQLVCYLVMGAILCPLEITVPASSAKAGPSCGPSRAFSRRLAGTAVAGVPYPNVGRPEDCHVNPHTPAYAYC